MAQFETSSRICGRGMSPIALTHRAAEGHAVSFVLSSVEATLSEEIISLDRLRPVDIRPEVERCAR